ncbi:MAG: hypothetical protein DBX47_00870 [Clostridiales bacterium]|nr:MAG: hypothetical protein DBX47_00870 [Clostridiales bacterium]
MKIKILSLLLIMCLSVGVMTSCSVKRYDRWLYGIHADFQDMEWEKLNPDEAVELLKMLGVKVVRVALNNNLVMSDNTTFIEEKALARQAQIKALNDAGIKILAVNSTWFLPPDVQEQSPSDMFLPERDFTEGSDYMRFLNDYEVMWENMANKFPLVTYWQTGNEPNQTLWFHKKDNANFPIQESMAINVDMMYRAARAIKKVNPKAVIVMPALAPLPNLEKCFNLIYDYIQSGEYGPTDVDSYFNIAAWHPYVQPGYTAPMWAKLQKAIYKTCEKKGDAGRRVIFTETGFQGGGDSDFWEQMYDQTRNELPFVDGMMVYCMTSHVLTGNSFGIFNTDSQTGSYIPLQVAWDLQNMFGGEGNLAKYNRIEN